MTSDPADNDISELESGAHDDKPPTIFQVIGSVLAAFFGVQSSKNKERDFKHGNHKVFIIVGILMTLVFLASVITVVQIVLAQ